MRLIPNWRRAPRMLSVQVASVVLAWGLVPADQQSAILELVGVSPARVPAILGLLVIMGRLIDQPKTKAPE